MLYVQGHSLTWNSQNCPTLQSQKRKIASKTASPSLFRKSKIIRFRMKEKEKKSPPHSLQSPCIAFTHSPGTHVHVCTWPTITFTTISESGGIGLGTVYPREKNTNYGILQQGQACWKIPSPTSCWVDAFFLYRVSIVIIGSLTKDSDHIRDHFNNNRR